MTVSDGARGSTVARVIHGAFVAGVVLFASVAHVILRPAVGDDALPRSVISALLGVSLLVTAVSVFVLRPRVPPRSIEESADLYWMKASVPALVTWAPIEGAALLAVVTYALAGWSASLVVAAIALFALLALHPGRFERA